MPAYEYQCQSCSYHFDQRQKMSDAPLTACPKCGGEVARLISGGAAAISKGGSSTSFADPGPSCGLGGCCGGGACPME